MACVITLENGQQIIPDTYTLAGHQVTVEATQFPVEDGQSVTDPCLGWEASVPVLDHPERSRNGLTQIMAIAGQALPPAVLLSYGYLSANSGYTAADIKRTFWKTVTNLGVVWGLFSVVVIVAGATALHDVYTGHGPTLLGVSHYSQIETNSVDAERFRPSRVLQHQLRGERQSKA